MDMPQSKNRPDKNDIINAAKVIPVQISLALEVAGGGPVFVGGDVLNINELSDCDSKQLWSENPHLKNQPIYNVDVELWMTDDEKPDWSISQLCYSRYSLIVGENEIIEERVVTGPGEFAWLEIEEVKQNYISVDDSEVPNEVILNLVSVILDYYNFEQGTNEFVSEIIEPMLDSLDSDEEEKKLVSSVTKPLRAEFKKFISPLKKQVVEDGAVRKKHPIWDPETLDVYEDELTTSLTFYSRQSDFRAKVFVVEQPTFIEPARICIEIYSRHRNVMHTREVLIGNCYFEVMVDDSFSSSEQLLNTLFDTGLLEKTISENFSNYF